MGGAPDSVDVAVGVAVVLSPVTMVWKVEAELEISPEMVTASRRSTPGVLLKLVITKDCLVGKAVENLFVIR